MFQLAYFHVLIMHPAISAYQYLAVTDILNYWCSKNNCLY